MSSDLFRKTALARLASPEQIDQLMEVTDTKGWWTLTALGTLIVAAVIWAVVGRIPTTVQGTGILLRQGGVFDIQTTAGGQLTELSVTEGQSVDAGQVVARVAQPVLVREIAEAQQVLDALMSRKAQASTFSAAELGSRLSTLEQRRAALVTDTTATQSQIRWLASRLTTQEEARRLGLVTGDQVEQARQQLATARGHLDDALTGLQQLEVDIISARRASATTDRTVDEGIADARRRLETLEGRLTQAERVVSPQAGRVLEVKADAGTIVAPGAPLVSIELASRPLRGMLVVSTAGRVAKPGMVVRVVPSTVDWQESGFILGRVESISETPVTLERLQRLLHNDVLSQSLMSRGATYLVEVSLQTANTASGFQWTTRDGPSQPVTTGMLATGRITVNEQRPISLVIPTLRKTVGL